MIDHAIITAKHCFTAQDFDDRRLPFEPNEYARLKYGDDSIARKFGFELADHFFAQHHGALLVESVVVIPSPYNYVENAATIMSRHFVRRLNHLLVGASGLHVDFATIQRKVNYTGDFGLLDAKARRELIGGDVFYVHEGYFEGRTMLFLDDIRITGAHEHRLMGLMAERPKLAGANIHFLYYGQLCGDETRSDVEAYLNSAEMTLDQYLGMLRDSDNHVIVRPIKWLMRMAPEEFERFLREADYRSIWRLYDGCLGEGYYKVPDYLVNFLALKKKIDG
jgi:hypothetical protein